MLTEPRQRKPSYSLLFAKVDRFGWASPPTRRASLDLDKCDHILAGHDEIELATSAPPILVENDPTTFFVPTSGELLALSSQLLSCMCHTREPTNGV